MFLEPPGMFNNVKNTSINKIGKTYLIIREVLKTVIYSRVHSQTTPKNVGFLTNREVPQHYYWIGIWPGSGYFWLPRGVEPGRNDCDVDPGAGSCQLKH
jgi:hypothetical protein